MKIFQFKSVLKYLFVVLLFTSPAVASEQSGVVSSQMYYDILKEADRIWFEKYSAINSEWLEKKEKARNKAYDLGLAALKKFKAEDFDNYLLFLDAEKWLDFVAMDQLEAKSLAMKTYRQEYRASWEEYHFLSEILRDDRELRLKEAREERDAMKALARQKYMDQ